jgi:hypothetical protein
MGERRQVEGVDSILFSLASHILSSHNLKQLSHHLRGVALFRIC